MKAAVDMFSTEGESKSVGLAFPIPTELIEGLLVKAKSQEHHQAPLTTMSPVREKKHQQLKSRNHNVTIQNLQCLWTPNPLYSTFLGTSDG